MNELNEKRSRRRDTLSHRIAAPLAVGAVYGVIALSAHAGTVGHWRFEEGTADQPASPLLGAILDSAPPANHGTAVGGGCELPLACHGRVAQVGTRIGLTEVTLGIVPGAGGAYFLPRLVGYTKALEMLLTGDFVDAQEALRIGLVNQVVPDDQLMEKTYELARKIAANAPLSVRLIKRAMVQGLTMDLRSHLDQISSHMGVVRGSEDHKEALAAFKEKRTPVFKGR